MNTICVGIAEKFIFVTFPRELSQRIMCTPAGIFYVKRYGADEFRHDREFLNLNVVFCVKRGFWTQLSRQNTKLRLICL